MPPNAEEGIREGMYRFRPAPEKGKHRAHLLASGPLVNEALQAQELLLQRYGVAADVWSVTSYKTLRVKTLEAERWNLWHPDEPPRVSYLQKIVQRFDGPCVAVSDYVRLVSQQISSVDTGRLAGTRNRRIRPKRYTQGAAPVLRNRCRTSGRRDVVRAASARCED